MAWKPDYTTAAALKNFMRIPSGDTADDTVIGAAITAVSRSIDDWTRRQFGLVSAPVARYYTPTYRSASQSWICEIDDLQTASGLAVAKDTDPGGAFSNAITAYTLAPLNAAADGVPWTELSIKQDAVNAPIFASHYWGGIQFSSSDYIKVTASFGWTAVPAVVTEAALLQASRLVSRRDAPFGIAGSPDAGSEIRLLSRLDPDVLNLLKPVYRWWGAY